MSMIINYSFIVYALLLLLVILLNSISKNSFSDREKNSPFECGFDPKNSSRLPFSLQFFLIAVIFLIFDVEITLIIPIIFLKKYMNTCNFAIYMYFILMLIFGLYYEWSQSALEWLL